MNKVKSLINRHGGTKRVAEKCGLNTQTVSMWNTRKSIPVRHWSKLVAAGITTDELLDAGMKSDEEAEAAA